MGLGKNATGTENKKGEPSIIKGPPRGAAQDHWRVVEREAPLGAGQLDTFFPHGIPSAALGGAKEYLALFNYSEIRNPKS